MEDSNVVFVRIGHSNYDERAALVWETLGGDHSHRWRSKFKRRNQQSSNIYCSGMWVILYVWLFVCLSISLSFLFQATLFLNLSIVCDRQLPAPSLKPHSLGMLSIANMGFAQKFSCPGDSDSARTSKAYVCRSCGSVITPAKNAAIEVGIFQQVWTARGGIINSSKLIIIDD